MRGVKRRVREHVSDAATGLDLALVRKSDRGLVVLPDRQVAVMRWGFARPFNNAVNNARSDRLDSGIWAEPFRERRCVIPVSAFYEWGPAPGGRKQAYEFAHPADDYLWIAGIWEMSDELGPCFSMLTTDAGAAMIGIHERMPAILGSDNEATAFLSGGTWLFDPYQGDLTTNKCASPLTRPRGDASQGELF